MAGLLAKVKNRFFSAGTSRDSINNAAQKQFDKLKPPKKKKQKSHVVIWPPYSK